MAKTFTAEMAAGIDLLTKLTGPSRVWLAIDPALPAKSLTAPNPLVQTDGLRVIQLPGDHRRRTRRFCCTVAGPASETRAIAERGGGYHARCAGGGGGGAICSAGEQMLEDDDCGSDHVAHKSYLLNVAVGTPLADVCLALNVPGKSVLLRGEIFCGIYICRPTRLLGSGELMVHITASQMPTVPDPCVRCGWCIEACPTGVHPARLLEASQREDEPLARKFGLHACIECGICSYVCPSRLPLLGSIRKSKTPLVLTRDEPVASHRFQRRRNIAGDAARGIVESDCRDILLHETGGAAAAACGF